MNLIMRKMTEVEYEKWIVISAKDQAKDQARVTGNSFDDELKKLNDMVPMLLPEGVDTPGHHFYSLDSNEAENFGMVWLGKIPNIPEGSTFLFHILINENQRSKGFGNKAMGLIHQEMKEKGYSNIMLNVMSDNFAKSLYERHGYETVQDNKSSLIMSKTL